MKNIRTYYKEALDKETKYLESQTDPYWWKKDDEYTRKGLETKGDYIETVGMLSMDEKNDTPIMSNHTNVRNMEWDVLFSMMASALLDWCNENGENDVYAFNLTVNRTLESGTDTIEYEPEIKMEENMKWNEPGTEAIVEKFGRCAEFLGDMFMDFIYRQGKDIPNDWNRFAFGLDSVEVSCKAGGWVPDSDGWMTLGNLTDGKYDEFVSCM